jgi:predicted phage terminase large subunit-like protein
VPTIGRLTLAEAEAALERKDRGQTLEEQAEEWSASLRPFVRHAWNDALGVADRFVPGWHIDAICEHLEAVTFGDLRRLVICVPPGSTKPVDAEALILMGDGSRKRLAEVVVGDEVITHLGRPRRVNNVYEQGPLATVRIETDCGRVVHAAPDHPFLTPQGWTEAGRLTTNDVVASVGRPQTMARSARPLEEFRLAGYVIGDGNTSAADQAKSCAANITCLDPIQAADILACLEALGFKGGRGERSAARRINMSGGVREWLVESALARKTSWTKRPPAWVFEGSDEQVAHFIGAYFACDGHLAQRQGRSDLSVIFTSVNRDLLADVQHLLLRLGIRSRIRAHRHGGFKGPNYLSYRIAITSLDDTSKFIDRIPVIGVKAERLKTWAVRRTRFEERLIPDPVISIEDGGLRECRCLSIDDDESFTANDIVVHNSTITSICWPAWEWTRDPRRRHLTASYDQRLATRFSTASRTLILSPWFQSRWGRAFRLKSDENLKTEYANDRGGRRLAISTSTGTGEHGDVLIIDDPHNAQEVLSDAAREQTIEWHDGTMTTRFTNSELGAEVIIAQRLHEKDLIGHVLAQEPEAWTVLCLPERYEPHHPHRTPAKVRLRSGRIVAGDPREEDGELLCPNRISDEANKARQRRLGAFRAAGQLQQRPAAREGAILKRTHWRFFPPAWLEDGSRHHLPAFHGLVQSWDTAFKDRTVNDYVAGSLWGNVGADMYLLAARKDHLSLSGTKQAIRDMTGWAETCWPTLGMRILVERSANGPEVITELQREIRGIIPVGAASQGSKVARAEAAEPALEGGNIYVPGAMAPDLPSFYDPAQTPAYAQSLIESCAQFPFGEHDDEVDAFTQAVNWSRGAGRRTRATLGRPAGILPEQGTLVGQLETQP